MTQKPLTNLPASIRQRLLNLAHERKDDFGLVLTQYAIERLLERLSRSSYRDQFVLKGAQLFSLWMAVPHRPTRDLDLLRQGEIDVPLIEAIFREISMLPTEPPDGISYDPDSVKGEVIREDAVYEGVRITIRFTLSGACDVLQVDIGVGDAVVPEPDLVEMPSLLNFSQISLRAYPKEAVIAEKLEAMVSLGIRNSRMKDFYDLWMLARFFQFDGRCLSQAIAATFSRRRTVIPSQPPLALTEEFWREPIKQAQWRAFLRRLRQDGKVRNLEQIIADLQIFLMPILHCLAINQDFSRIWNDADGWQTDNAIIPVSNEDE